MKAALKIGTSLAVLLLIWVVLSRRPPAEDLLSADEAQELGRRTAMLVAGGRHAEALPAAERLHAGFPENHIYIESLAGIYGRLGRHKEEAETWEKYLERAPRPVEACPQIGLAYRKLGQAEAALGAFERCLGFDPRNADSIFYVAHALEMAQQFERAGQLYSQGQKLAPGNPDFAVGLARLALHRGNLAAARKGAAEVLEKHPRHGDALLVLGLVHLREGNHEPARQALERGAALSEQNGEFLDALSHLGEAERRRP